MTSQFGNPVMRVWAVTSETNITLSHLPPDTRSQFNSHFKPSLLQWAGTLPAWEGIESWEDIAELWNKHFSKHPLGNNKDLQVVVVKLAEAKINTWRHTFASAAIASLEQLLDAWGLEDAHERGETVKWLLEKQDNGSRVFWYRKFYADPVEGADPEDELEVNPVGLFGGHLIIDALASHYKSAYPGGLANAVVLPKGYTTPVGPLVYAIQASQRALNYYKSGKLTIPSQRLGEFSKTNWGDRSTTRNSELIPVNTTSELLAYIKELTDRQWTRIVEAAIAACRTSRKAEKATEVIDVDEAPPRASYKLPDNDSD
ncbi:hypothetical protein B0H11DRAFT_2229813 [Mycena galericulata]|nr:hypothetical protein B0H11DRAFT_2229813 [Mycena galericulata]